MSLVIEIYQRFGRMNRFSQDEPALIGQILEKLKPAQVFTQPRLLLGNALSYSLFNTANIARIELPGYRPAEWGGGDALPTLFKIDDEGEFLHLASQFKTLVDTQEAWSQPGAKLRWYAVLEMTGGERVFTGVEGKAVLPAERYILLNRVFELPALVLERADGGACLINPALIERITAYPGLPELPGHGIPADCETY